MAPVLPPSSSSSSEVSESSHLPSPSPAHTTSPGQSPILQFSQATRRILAMAKQSGDMSSWMEVAPALLLAPFPRRRSFSRPGLDTIAEEEEEEGDHSEAEELKDKMGAAAAAAAAANFRDL
ncbi:hypothetical protein BT93_L2608 [Corymbia citriodora subsp. variegata]|uniref:Uncharacterized protein n=1 Tax=Corymbia citriodora subsp. variegata TaxID=360336 RepID=A0A8T0CLU6_CORYI|nr:hypothetical protein BT93_L2608 [Corymbia citriodora subsp. variegata]